MESNCEIFSIFKLKFKNSFSVKFTIKFILVLLLANCVSIQISAQRQIQNFNDSWKFGADSDELVIKHNYDDQNWKIIHLPHTWNGLDGQDGGNDLYRGAKWYRKTFVAHKNWSGKRVFLKFGAANMKADVFLNGKHLGEHIGGYAAFVFDITNYLIPNASNILAVKVDNSATIDAAPLSADFSFFGGITRDVQLIVTNSVFISPLDYASSGVYITPQDITSEKAKVNLKVLVANYNKQKKKVEISATIKSKEGLIVAELVKTNFIDPFLTDTVDLNTVISNPILWDGVINPYLYKVEVSLRVNNKTQDNIVQPLGIRTFSVDLDKGFILNNKAYNLHGVCLHEDRPDVGRAISDAQRKEDLTILQELGCTYLRLVHSQHGEYTYNYCDSIGMVLSTEIPLVNKISASAAFSANAKSQLKELIKQNYNHPSVLFWGLYNEVNFHKGPSPAPLVSELNKLAHKLDATRLTTGAAQKDEADTHWTVDVCGWNKYMGWYDGSYDDYGSWADWLKKSYPQTKIAMSEYGAGASIHHHQETNQKPNPGGRFHPEEYQSNYHEAYYKEMLKRPYLWSTAIWVAFDFASDYRAEGDALGINDKGLVTRDRKTNKDAFYFYKAHWNSSPFVYLTSKRFRERNYDLIPVKVYSNCDSVQLFVNGVSQGVLSSDSRVYVWKNIKLTEKSNEIKVLGYCQNEIKSDSCRWNLNLEDSKLYDNP